MRKNGRQVGQLNAALCEALEERRLLVAFQLFVDGNPVPAPTTINFGTVSLNAAAPQHSIGYKYLGNASVQIHTRLELGDADTAFQLSGDSGFKTINKNET